MPTIDSYRGLLENERKAVTRARRRGMPDRDPEYFARCVAALCYYRRVITLAVMKRRAEEGSDLAQRRVAWVERVLAYRDRMNTAQVEISRLEKGILELEGKITGTNPRTGKPYHPLSVKHFSGRLPLAKQALEKERAALEALLQSPPPPYRLWAQTATAALLALRQAVGDAGAEAIERIAPMFLRLRSMLNTDLWPFSDLLEKLIDETYTASEKLPERTPAQSALFELNVRLSHLGDSFGLLCECLTKFQARFGIRGSAKDPQAEAWLRRHLEGLSKEISERA